MIIVPDNTMVEECVDFNIQKQQAGIDLTLKSVNQSIGNIRARIDFSNEKRVIPEVAGLPLSYDEDDIECWFLRPGFYIINYNEKINVPQDCVGQVFPRSSLMRTGGMLFSALWDPGYNGKGVGMLLISQDTLFYKNARIAQIIFHKVEGETRKYNGVYQGEGTV